MVRIEYTMLVIRAVGQAIQSISIGVASLIFTWLLWRLACHMGW